MINTFHTSYNPPPVPPRAQSRKPQPVGNTSLVKFLSIMLLLLMILSFGGFLYLFQKFNMQQHHKDMMDQLEHCVNDKLGEDSVAECDKLIEHYEAIIAKVSKANGKVAKLTGGLPFNGPAAHMVLLNEHRDESKDTRTNNLLWDLDHSMLKDVRLSSKRDMLIIQYPGIYFIYSQVTFSRNSKNALKQAIRIKEPKKEEYKELLKSFCSLTPSTSTVCTASMAGVFQLQTQQQLYVTVTNTSLVNRDSCSFGLFKLQ